MSEENVEAVRLGQEAINRRDVEAVLEGLDPEVEWHDVFQVMLGGEAKVYRGHAGVRDMFRDLYEAFIEIRGEFSEIRDLGDRIVVIGRLSARGKQSGAEIESPLGSMLQFRHGRAVQIRTYLDPKEALEAAGLRE
jgi:ketosteroid isomerase-like protein